VELASCATRLLGREAERAQLLPLAEPVPHRGRVLILLGAAGMGKTVLLADAANRASCAGMRVQSVTCKESESDLAFAGLHQLLWPVTSSITGLPGRQAKALRQVLGLEAEPPDADRLLTGIAVLGLLSGLSQESPVLLIVDDAHWLDRSSLDALAFAACRLGPERAVLLVGARGTMPPPGFGQGFGELRLGPLSPADAGRLLDEQPCRPAGHVRRRVLDQAAGNPLALIELAKAIAADPAAGRGRLAEPLPLTDRLTAVFAAQLAALPEPAQTALLLAAVGDGADSATAASRLGGVKCDVLIPAEEAGLVTVDRERVCFAHPLVRSAVYHTAAFARRAAAHRRIADALHDQPDRRAWHLAAAARHPDEQVAALLSATANQAGLRSGAAAAALALERAAELSPDPDDRARRLVSAAAAAVATGQADWVHELATRALAATADPQLRLLARRSAGWALAWSSQHADALATLLPVASEATAVDPVIAWDALATASTVAYQCGDPGAVQAVRDTVDYLEQATPPRLNADEQGSVDAARLWIVAATGGCGDTALTVPALDPDILARLPEPYLSTAGAAAWLLDEPDLAISLLQAARQQLGAQHVRGASGASLSALGWAFLDAGRWAEALEVAAEAGDLAAASGMDIVAASSNLITGTILAARGEADGARDSIGRALAPGTQRSRSVAARARHALGVAAFAEGNYLQAYVQLRQLFSDDSVPLHYHVSYLGIADLAAAAVRTDCGTEVRRLLTRIGQNASTAQSPRRDQLLGRALGNIAEPPGPEIHFARTLSDPAGSRWPFERAQLRLDFGEWLRRQRRINEAKPVLTSALETFQQLDARPWAHRAEAELRACGVPIAPTPAAAHVLSQLSPQQREIVQLAARGHSNREIAGRLFLSPRTVASHLYRTYPKLGIASRNQLRDLIDFAARDVMPGADTRLPGR
jgi:DNA-binding CsgD family transcriptional regulator/tetratricopeptide (TPR) repeat protein